MTSRSRLLLFLPIAFPLLLPRRCLGPCRGHEHGRGRHHPSHYDVFGFGHPSGYAPCGPARQRAAVKALPGSLRSSAREGPARGPPGVEIS
jgi:hypothetical protein